MLDAQGWLVDNPKLHENRWSRSYQWPQRLIKQVPWLTLGKHPTFSLDIFNSLIFQELNVAYGYHETVSDFFLGSLIWLESGGRDDMRVLAIRYNQPLLARINMSRYYTKPSVSQLG